MVANIRQAALAVPARVATIREAAHDLARVSSGRHASAGRFQY